MHEVTPTSLQLLGFHEDGEHLLLSGPGGERYILPITSELRAAARGDRPHLEHLKANGNLSPRQVQTYVRSGKSAQEIATEHNIPLEYVQRYESPVLAERSYIAQNATKTRVGRELDSPILGDLVTDRLAVRGVDVSDLRWDAAKRDGYGWVVSVTFIDREQQRIAQWNYDPQGQTLGAIEENARELTEKTISDEPIPMRHLSAVKNRVFDYEVDTEVESEGNTHISPITASIPRISSGAVKPATNQEATGIANEQATAQITPETTPEPEKQDNDAAGDHSEAARSQVNQAPATNQEAASETEDSQKNATSFTPRKGNTKRSRAKVPSWDEIVFGSPKND